MCYDTDIMESNEDGRIIPIVAFTGRSGSGKTTLLVQLITELTRRGVRVATVKHHAHRGLQVDRPDKDTWRHAQAGSQHVVIAAPDQVASIRRIDREPALEDIAGGILAAAVTGATAVDLILVEGYKQAAVPAIEIVRAPEWYLRNGPKRPPDAANHERGQPLSTAGISPEHRIAIVTDLADSPAATDSAKGSLESGADVPRFPLDDINGLADLIRARFLAGGIPAPSNPPLAPNHRPRALKGPRLFCIVGRGGAGRTTLIEKLILELAARGHRVGTVKHHAHPGFQIDRLGKDTWRHAQAGSRHVVLASPDMLVSMRCIDREIALEDLVAAMTDVDIVLAEGYLRTCRHRIEVVRAARSPEPLCPPDQLLALATDLPLDLGVPRFDLEDTAGLAGFVENSTEMS